MDKPQLLSCPFCGGQASQYDRINASNVTCKSCGAKVNQSAMGIGDAPALWNRRVPTPAVSGIEITLKRTLGATGVAFDPPGPRRAYTYQHQPGNIEAWRMGEACRKAAYSPGGDPIDGGLSMLKELQAIGYGVFAIEPSPLTGVTAAASLGIDAPEQPFGIAAQCGAMHMKPTAGDEERLDAALNRVFGAPEHARADIVRFDQLVEWLRARQDWPQVILDGRAVRELVKRVAPPAVQPPAEWLAEAERLASEHGRACYKGCANEEEFTMAALLTHLRTHPAAQQGGKK